MFFDTHTSQTCCLGVLILNITVQYLAGHEHAKITLDIYAHLTYNRPEGIIDKINMAFAPQT